MSNKTLSSLSQVNLHPFLQCTMQSPVRVRRAQARLSIAQLWLNYVSGKSNTVACCARSGSKFTAHALSQILQVSVDHESDAHGRLNVSWIHPNHFNAYSIRLVRNPVDCVNSILRRGFLTPDNNYGKLAEKYILQYRGLTGPLLNGSAESAITYFVEWHELIPYECSVLRVEDLTLVLAAETPDSYYNKGDRLPDASQFEDLAGVKKYLLVQGATNLATRFEEIYRAWGY